MNPDPTLCTCGHEKETHYISEGGCFHDSSSHVCKRFTPVASPTEATCKTCNDTGKYEVTITTTADPKGYKQTYSCNHLRTSGYVETLETIDEAVNKINYGKVLNLIPPTRIEPLDMLKVMYERYPASPTLLPGFQALEDKINEVIQAINKMKGEHE